MRIKKYEPGSFFKVELGNGWHSYARLTQVSPYVAFYDLSHKDLTVEEIKKTQILFVIWAFTKEIGTCKRIGYSPLEANEITLPLLFRQDIHMGKYWIFPPYELRDVETTREACVGLEHAGFWFIERFQQRLIDYQNGVPNFDLEYFKLK